MEDQTIIELYFARDERALSETAGKYGRLLQKLANDLTGDRSDAEEIVNDAYLAAWNGIPPQRPAHLSAYLAGIVRNLSFKRFERAAAEKRAATVELTEELCDCIPGGETVEKAYESAELSKLLDRFVRGLGREERYLFMQRYYWSRSIRELSEELEQSESKVKSTLFRIRKKLRKLLTEADDQ